MALVASIAVLAAAGMFLLALGVVALVRPRLAQRFLLSFAESPAKHYSELAVRFSVGAALVFAAPSLAAAEVLSAAGWVLLVTTAFMLFVPWRSHRAFAQRAVPMALAYLPAIGMSALAAGTALLWALVGAGAA